MRLRRLALTRYGKFTNRILDFGEAVGGEPDLHIVYGPNEAGKTTALSGFLDLLFGIEMQSRYNFLHPYDTMCVGGCLELSVGPRELVRTKGRQLTLRDADNQPVSESLILGDLGGLDRNAYRTMFSLDDDTLEAGGNSILASSGELGQLLFSASAGLAELSQTLIDIRVKANGFTFPNARSGELHQLKAGLATLKQQREAIDTLASEYSRLAAERDLTASRYEAALAEQAAAQASLAGVARLLVALPRLAALRRHQRRLSDFANLPDVPEHWLADLAGLEQAETRHHTATTLAETEVNRLTTALEAVVVDTVALGLAGSLDQLTTLGARHRTAELDLPLRRREIAVADGEIANILARLERAGEADPGRLQLTAVQSATLDTLMEGRSGVEAKLIGAREELAQAQFDLGEARQALEAEHAAAVPSTMPMVVSALQAWRDSDHLRRQRDANRARLQQRDTLHIRLQILAPWTGDVEALAQLILPDADTVMAWEEDAAQHAAILTRRRDEVERLEGDLALREAEMEAIGSTGGLLNDKEAAEIRAAREAAWAAHRRALDVTTADAFEETLRRDDIVGATRLGHERDLAKLHETTQAVAVKRSELAHASALLREANIALELSANNAAEAISRISSELAGFAPARLLSWMAQRDEALECWHQLRQADRDIAEAEADDRSLRCNLLEALTRAGVTIDPTVSTDALIGEGQAVVERESRVQALRQKVADCQREARRREAAAEKAAQADAEWRTAWHEACRSCWLGETVVAMPFGAVREILTAAAELGPALKTRDSLKGRVRAMEEDQAMFRSELSRLASELGLETGSLSEAEVEKAIFDRVEDARRADRERRKLHELLVGAQETWRTTRAAAEAHARRTGEMMETLQASTLLEVAGKLRDAKEKADIEKMAADEERGVLAALHVNTFTDALILLEGKDEGVLEVEQARLSGQLTDLEARTRELFAAKERAADRIEEIGGDDAAAQIEERRRTQLLEIEEKAQQYLRLRFGISAAERALRTYRDQHRSSMMTQASDAFSLISRGAYRGLSTQPGKDGDILVALAADGGSKLATDLSKGTRFQLYLALRAAGYREFAKFRPTVPFVADDIMETFDDFRSEETLRMLEGLSRLGQVIYLTHHSHLRSIAERVAPNAQFHELAP